MRTVAGFAEEDASFLTALISGRTSTDQRANSLGSREAIPMVAKHNQQFGCKQWSSARQRVEDGSIGMLPEEFFDISNFLILALNKIEKELSQVDGLITMGQRADGVGFEGRATETSKQLRKTTGIGIGVRAAKGSELGVGEGLGSIGYGVSDEKGAPA